MKVMAALNAKDSLAAGIIAAIGASVCCVGPLLLLALGIGGAWIEFSIGKATTDKRPIRVQPSRDLYG